MQGLLNRQLHRPVVRCRDGSQNGVVTTTTTVTVSAEAPKIEKTISTLDNLLGPSAQAAPPPPRPQPAVEKPASQAGVFDWPTGTTSKPSSPAPAAAARKSQQTFDSVMGFEGLAPEIINARAAMIGFIAAFTTELSTGESVFAQLLGGGAAKAAIVIAAVTLASFAPAIRQIPLEDVFNKPKNPKNAKAFGPFAPDSELTNGRLAMVALAVMLLLEGTSGQAFFL